ncbi:MAG TPA: PIG-L family deacetylase [Clostridiales bacterium]|nr:PIG-L family deacetylase [Clostridiales bacterium]
MSKKHRAYIPIVGSIAALSLSLYMKDLLKMQLTTDEKTAIYNGNIILQPNSKILAITAHPEDLALFIGGTLKHLAKRNCDITIINVTNSKKGVDLTNLTQIRQSEQTKAANRLEVKDVRFLHLPDLHLTKIKDIEPILKNILLDIKPDIIFAFDFLYPFKALKHPDHVSIGQMVHKASSVLKNTKCQIAFYASCKPNSIVDIVTTLEEKIAAVKCHQSQLRFGEDLCERGIRRFAKYSARHTLLHYGETFRLKKI